MANDDAIRLDAGDVSIVRIEPTVCDHCEKPATHYIMLHMRSLGSSAAVAACCEAHAEDVAKDLRASLPEPTEDER